MTTKLLTTTLLLLALLSACGSTPSQSAASANVPGPIVPVGQPEVVDLGPTTETVWNCGESGGTVIKHPSMSVVTSHAVEWEVGGSTGAGLTIGEGVIPGGVNLSASLEGHYTSQFDQSVQQSTAWDLPAEKNAVVIYTIMWRESWQRGYIDTRLADQSVMRIDVRYRTGIQSEIVGKRPGSCQGEQPQAVPQQATPIQSGAPLQPETTMPPISSTQPTQICQEAGGASGFPLSQTPSVPTNGCILIIEWWVPPDASNCGIIITTSNPVFPNGAIGTWWYVYPQRPDSHKQEFLAKNPQCKVEDLR